MAMIETAYSLRKCTDVLVASEELEPGTGWDHTLVLSKLVAAPAITPEALGKAIVISYQERYGNGDMTTLSALRMADVDAASAAISRTAAQLLASKNQSFPELRKVRDSMYAFADYRNIGFAVDAQTLFERIAANCTHPEVKAEASATVQALKAMVISNYASNSTADYGPQGLAIYFPHSRTKFESDRDGQGYLRSNTIHPVDFVRDNEWAVLLREFLQLPA
jgi:hypothetical protein